MVKLDFPSDSSFSAAAWLLGCRVETIKAFAMTECGREGGFLDSGEPVLLYERHKFHKYTGGRYDGKLFDLENDNKPGYFLSSSKPGGYGPVSIQHAKLQAAVKLDRDAALMSCSWGLFQIMGENYELCGYQSIQRFVTAMYRSVDDHLKAFCQFIRHNKKVVNGKMLIDAIRGDANRVPDFLTSALIYNGPKMKEYDLKFKANFESIIKKG
jgi:hypothetical protein